MNAIFFFTKFNAWFSNHILIMHYSTSIILWCNYPLYLKLSSHQAYYHWMKDFQTFILWWSSQLWLQYSQNTETKNDKPMPGNLCYASNKGYIKTDFNYFVSVIMICASFWLRLSYLLHFEEHGIQLHYINVLFVQSISMVLGMLLNSTN